PRRRPAEAPLLLGPETVRVLQTPGVLGSDVLEVCRAADQLRGGHRCIDAEEMLEGHPCASWEGSHSGPEPGGGARAEEGGGDPTATRPPGPAPRLPPPPGPRAPPPRRAPAPRPPHRGWPRPRWRPMSPEGASPEGDRRPAPPGIACGWCPPPP